MRAVACRPQDVHSTVDAQGVQVAQRLCEKHDVEGLGVLSMQEFLAEEATAYVDHVTAGQMLATHGIIQNRKFEVGRFRFGDDRTQFYTNHIKLPLECLDANQSVCASSQASRAMSARARGPERKRG